MTSQRGEVPCMMQQLTLLLVLCLLLHPSQAWIYSTSIRQLHYVRRLPSMQLQLSPVVQNMALSKTIEIHSLTKELEKSGKTVYSLCVGEPDYQAPKEVIDATVQAAQAGLTKYTAVNGDLALRQAIAEDLQRRKGLPYSADQVVVANGAKQAAMQALMAVVTPGDEVLIPSPYWTSYPDMVKLCQGLPVAMPTLAEEGYQINAHTLRQYLTNHPKVSCMILCNPSNPTGTVYSEDTLRGMAEVLRDFPRVAVVSDEIYEKLTYDGLRHRSFAAVDPEIFPRIITVNGFSKSFAMTGYRLGYTASSVAVAQAVTKLQSQLTSCASSISQAAGLAALQAAARDDGNWMKERIVELEGKRTLALSLLAAIPQVSVHKPQGAFYLFPRIDHYLGRTYTSPTTGEQVVIRTSHDLCLQLLKTEGVALVPGEAFGDARCVRLSYAASQDTIRQALTRLKTFLLQLTETSKST